MALYNYTGEVPTIFSAVRLEDGSTLKAEPGGSYELAEDPNTPLLVLADGSAPVEAPEAAPEIVEPTPEVAPEPTPEPAPEVAPEPAPVEDPQPAA